MFERAVALQPESPKIQSFFGYCIAYERGKIKEAINLCEKALKADPESIENYINLGRVYRKAGFKLKAIEIFRRGLELHSDNQELLTELRSIGVRRGPVLSFLPRSHFLNKYIGLTLSKLGFR